MVDLYRLESPRTCEDVLAFPRWNRLKKMGEIIAKLQHMLSEPVHEIADTLITLRAGQIRRFGSRTTRNLDVFII